MFLLELLFKTSIVLAASGVAALLLRRGSAASRHAVWVAGLIGAIGIALGMSVLPRWPVIISATVNVIQPLASVPATTIDTGLEARPDDRAPSAGAAATASRGSGVSVTLIWAMGVGLLLLRVVAGEFGVRRLARQASSRVEPRIRIRLEQLQRSAGIERPVRLLVTPDDCVPVTWGTRRPVILLPSAAAAWPAHRLDAVLAHELAHVARRDVLWSLLGRGAVALCWHNPLVWLAAIQMRQESERACDDAVLRSGVRASDYADELVALARALGARRPLDAAAPAMFGRSRLESRVSALLDGRIARGRASTASAGAAILVIATALPLSALTPAAIFIATPVDAALQGPPSPPPVPPPASPQPPPPPPPPPPRAIAPSIAPPARRPDQPPPPPPPPVIIQPSADFAGSWIAADADRADKLFEVGLMLTPSRITIDQDDNAVTLSATAGTGPITLVCRLDGVPAMGEGLHLTAIESRAFRSGNVLTVDHYRSGAWISQTRLVRRGEQLTIESRSKFNTVTTVYRKIS